MKRLTDEERMALVEVGAPGEGPVSDATFAELAALGWGYWATGPTWWDWITRKRCWVVTAAGRAALEYDTIARSA